jgi:hypothetical protein
VAPRAAGSIEIQEFGFQGAISEAVLSKFVLLAIVSIVERAVGEACVIPKPSADHLPHLGFDRIVCRDAAVTG